MLYWLVVFASAIVLPTSIVMLVHADGLSAVTATLSSRRALYFVCLMATGLVAGLFMGTELGQVRVQEGLNAKEFTFFKQRFELAIGKVMPPVLVLTTLSSVPLLIALRHGPRVSLVLVASGLALWVAATIVTVVFDVPVNSAAPSWDPAHPRAD
jgi:uncharacterized membrane protein